MAEPYPPNLPIGGAATRHEATGDDDIQPAGLYRRQHSRQQRLVVLKIRVDYRYVRCLGAGRALDAGGGRPAAADAPDAADVFAAFADLMHDFAGAVGRVVVDENCFPMNAGQSSIETVGEERDVLGFVECRDDHGQLWRNTGNDRFHGDLARGSPQALRGRKISEVIHRCGSVADRPQSSGHGFTSPYRNDGEPTASRIEKE